MVSKAPTLPNCLAVTGLLHCVAAVAAFAVAAAQRLCLLSSLSLSHSEAAEVAGFATPGRLRPRSGTGVIFFTMYGPCDSPSIQAFVAKNDCGLPQVNGSSTWFVAGTAPEALR